MSASVTTGSLALTGGGRAYEPATLYSTDRNTQAHQMIESITSLSCVGDIVNSVAKQCFVIACSRLKNCSRCSG